MYLINDKNLLELIIIQILQLQVVLENSCRADEHECPFGRSSVELVRLLCNVLKISEQPSEQTTTYHQIFFSHDNPFHELYCVCIVLLNKTWKEMRATTEDFVKVKLRTKLLYFLLVHVN